MYSASLLVVCALCSPLAVASSPVADYVAAEQQSCQSSSCALELLQRSALSFNKAQLSSGFVPPPIEPLADIKEARMPFYLDSECSQLEGSLMVVSLETDECLMGWNYTCSCSSSNEKIVVGHRYKNGCGDPTVEHVRSLPIGRCLSASVVDSDANKYVKVDDFGACPCCGSKCSVYGDPHITVFDQAEVSLLDLQGSGTNNDAFGNGDYWLVKSNLVHVQGRYQTVVYPKAKFHEHSFLTGVAIGGPFLEGNVLLIGPRDTGRVQLVSATGEVQEILRNGGMYKDHADLIEAHYRPNARMVKDSSETAPGIYFHFPSGVNVEVNRFAQHIDFSITMAQEAAGGNIDGQCGNFNGNPADDTAGLIAARMGYEIPKDELLFLDEDEDDDGEEELMAEPGHSSDGLSVLEEKASEMTKMRSSSVALGRLLDVHVFKDRECTEKVDGDSHFDVPEGVCDFGWKMDCTCSGTQKAVIATPFYPSCSVPPLPEVEMLADVCYYKLSSAGDDQHYAFGSGYFRIDASACPCCDEPAKCTVHGDPHITVFDKAESKVLGLLGDGSKSEHPLEDKNDEGTADMYGWGDFWLVKSEQVLIQARYRKVYYPKALEPLNHTYLTSVAVGGPFMHGHKIIVEPRNGLISWSLGQEQKSILDDGNEESSFEIENLIKGRYHNRTSIVPGSKPVVPGVDLELPDGVKVIVDRFGKHLDLQISMQPSSGGPSGIDGQCGNYNGDASDDTAELINSRIGHQVPSEECLFERNVLDMQA